jgi:predicted metal-binding membrane protein
MSAMAGMPMPGGWTMSMTWMRAPGETWAGTAASFLSMWTVMTVAMMLPSLVPMLGRYRQAVAGEDGGRLDPATAVVGAGYLFVWAVVGMVVFVVGVAFASLAMRQPAVARGVPAAAGVIVVVAGRLQFSAWKARHLACWRDAPQPGVALPSGMMFAWRHGVRLGVHCAQASAGLMAVLLAIGVMDPAGMVLVGAAITAERVAPAGDRIAHAIGAVVVAGGAVLMGRAAGIG